MITLSTLQDTTRVRIARKRLGRGVGSGLGKTSGRGHKGAGSRSGWKSRASYEGGQKRLFQKLPIRGFSNERFRRRLDEINLGQLDHLFQDGEEVSVDTLRERGYLSGSSYGLKVLGQGECTRKVTIYAQAISASALEKCQANGINVVLPE